MLMTRACRQGTPFLLLKTRRRAKAMAVFGRINLRTAMESRKA